MLFGGVLLGGLAFGKPLLGVVFDSVFHLTEEGWRKLTLRWALFFFALAVLNEIVWRTQIDRRLGELQGFRRVAADLRVRGAAVSADARNTRSSRKNWSPEDASDAGRDRSTGEQPALSDRREALRRMRASRRLSGVIGPISL